MGGCTYLYICDSINANSIKPHKLNQECANQELGEYKKQKKDKKEKRQARIIKEKENKRNKCKKKRKIKNK